MRVIIAAISFAVCFGAGLLKSRSLQEHAVLLRQIRDMLRGFSLRMRYISPTVEELLSTAQCGFAEEIMQRAAAGEDVRTAWHSSCERLPFSSEEQNILQEIGAQLGTSSTQEQLAMLAMYDERLTSLLVEADGKCTRLCRMYRTVGALVGAAAAVLII